MIRSLFFSILVFFPILCFAEKEVQHKELEKSIEKVLSKSEYSKFSGVLFVSVGDKKVINLGVGKSDVERKIPFSDKTLVPVGSITKQFTGAAVLKLEMLGKLSTDDKASVYIPSLTGKLRETTIHELLTHTSGITNETGRDDAAVTSKSLIKHLNEIQLSYDVGTYHYSNLGYSLLGLIVESVSGEPIDQFLANTFFKSIGMLKTGYTYPYYKNNEVSRGYLNGKDWGYLHEKNWGKSGPYWNLRANGGMLSTVEDMYRWHNALHFGDYLSEEAKRKYFGMHVKEFEDGNSYYGYGWVTEILSNGHKMIWHDGGNGIFSADVRYYPSSQIYYFIAGNRSDGEIYDISNDIHNILQNR